jgi:hypothetical protein
METNKIEYSFFTGFFVSKIKEGLIEKKGDEISVNTDLQDGVRGVHVPLIVSFIYRYGLLFMLVLAIFPKVFSALGLAIGCLLSILYFYFKKENYFTLYGFFITLIVLGIGGFAGFYTKFEILNTLQAAILYGIIFLASLVLIHSGIKDFLENKGNDWYKLPSLNLYVREFKPQKRVFSFWEGFGCWMVVLSSVIFIIIVF